MSKGSLSDIGYTCTEILYEWNMSYCVRWALQGFFFAGLTLKAASARLWPVLNTWPPSTCMLPSHYVFMQYPVPVCYTHALQLTHSQYLFYILIPFSWTVASIKYMATQYLYAALAATAADAKFDDCPDWLEGLIAPRVGTGCQICKTKSTALSVLLLLSIDVELIFPPFCSCRRYVYNSWQGYERHLMTKHPEHYLVKAHLGKAGIGLYSYQ